MTYGQTFLIIHIILIVAPLLLKRRFKSQYTGFCPTLCLKENFFGLHLSSSNWNNPFLFLHSFLLLLFLSLSIYFSLLSLSLSLLFSFLLSTKLLCLCPLVLCLSIYLYFSLPTYLSLSLSLSFLPILYQFRLINSSYILYVN